VLASAQRLLRVLCSSERRLRGDDSLHAIAEARCAPRETPRARSERARTGPRIGRFACRPASNAAVHDRGPAGGLKARPASARQPSRKSTIPMGASGVVFGYASYLVKPGVLRPSALELAIGAVVVFVWAVRCSAGCCPRRGSPGRGTSLARSGARGGVGARAPAGVRAAQPAKLAGWPPTCVSGWFGPSSSASS
jgi:hypothetical protein